MSAVASGPPAGPLVRRLGWAGFWLGFALGGFFDGILLHQILQWHHLLSGWLPGETAADLRFQVLADGLFHAFTYAVAVVGLSLLWTARGGLGRAGADRRLVALALIGFGTWHIVDAVLSHWLLGLHRIRMDVDDPLLWDLLWFVPFGVVVALAGLWLLRRPDDGAPDDGTHGGDDPGGGPHGGAPDHRRPGGAPGESAARRGVLRPLALALAVLAAGPIAALPPPGAAGDLTLAVFRRGLGFADIVAAADAVGGRPVWTDPAAGVWLIEVGDGARAAGLYRHGAIMVANGPFAAGCLSWTEPAGAAQLIAGGGAPAAAPPLRS